MKSLTDEQRREYAVAWFCGACGEMFEPGDKLFKKVRHHDHASGEFLFAACNRCNLQMKFSRTLKKKKKQSENGGSDDTFDDVMVMDEVEERRRRWE